MNPEDPRGKIVHALQERAKELNCLYRVGELLNQPNRDLEDIFRGIIEITPVVGNIRGCARLEYCCRT